MSSTDQDETGSLHSKAIFLPASDSDCFIPTDLALGPWHKQTQHGGPILGLLARAIERHPSERPVQVTRLTVDLLRSAPMAEVKTSCRTIRPGKRVEVVEAVLESGGEVYARATAMRFRVTRIEVDANQELGGPPALPESAARPPWPEGGREAFHHAMEMRPAMGHELPGIWVRLNVPLVADEETTPLVRVATASDSTYSVAFVAKVMSDPRALGADRAISINPDTTLNLHRPLRGDWVCLQGWSHLDESGAGTAFARIFDENGAVGHASQSILVRGPEARPESWDEFDKIIERRKG